MAKSETEAIGEERQNIFLLAQYTSLRDEVLRRIELQHQLILGTLVAVGSILTVSIQGGESTILLIYPFLAMFLSLAWSQNDARNRQINQLLSMHEELFLKDISMGWEQSRTSARLWFLGSRKIMASRGIFVGSQFLALFVFWITTKSTNRSINSMEELLIILDLILIFLTILIIGFPSPKPTLKPKS